MSKYSTLKAEIIASIKRNGAQAITGDLLQEKLLAMIDSLGEHYQFGGLVSHDTEFIAGDEPVAFIAATPGTYTNFGGLVVADSEVALLVWSGSAWSKQTTDIATRSEVSQLGQDVDEEAQARILQLGGNAEETLDWRNLSINTSDVGTHPFASLSPVSNRISSYYALNLPVGTKIKVGTETGYWIAVSQFNEGYPDNQAPINSSWLQQGVDTEITISRPNVHFTMAKGASRTDAIMPAEGVNANIYIYPTAILQDFTPLLYTNGYIDCDNVNKKFIVKNQLIVKHGGNSYIIANNTELAYDTTISSAYQALVYDTATNALRHIAHGSVNYNTQAVILTLVVTTVNNNYVVVGSTIPVLHSGITMYESNKFPVINGFMGEIVADNISKKITVNVSGLLAVQSLQVWSNFASKIIDHSTPLDFSAMGTNALLIIDFKSGTLKLTNTPDSTYSMVLASIVIYRHGNISDVIEINSPGIKNTIIAPYINRQEELYYNGQKLNLRNRIRRFLLHDFGTLTTGGNQGFLAYGDYSLFYGVIGGTTEEISPEEIAKINLFQTSTGEKIADISLNTGNMDVPWGNTICWGNKYSSDDPLPLLYISQTRQVSARGCLVYRLQESGGVWSATLVQTILAPGDFLGLGFGDWVVDTDNGYLYSVRNLVSGFLGKTWKVAKFELPDISESNVLLDENDIIETWNQSSNGTYLPTSTKMIYNGVLFFCGGHDTWPSTSFLLAVELQTHVEINKVNLYGFGGEPQGTCVYEGLMLWVHGNNGKVFAMDFD